MGEQREALQQLLSFGGSVYVYGHRLSLHYRHKPGRVGALDWLKPFERLYRINLSGGNVDEVLNKWPRMEKINWFDITAAKRDLKYEPQRSIQEALEALREAHERETLRERGRDGGAL